MSFSKLINYIKTLLLVIITDNMNIKKQYFCNNCGKLGHLFHQCKVPITSIGIIPIRIVKKYNASLNKYENSIDPHCVVGWM